ncbi:MAG: gliding motility-associated C-terminal domain-containing protein [Saprospiraceae bacterium]|nr:gliding motility-associated C-terminal domain-containing protein [Saprospiraceae bacterium]MCF8248316.1 gliding motility-associated C-terminal domain-containing protein [Saprospiraceae bacterium]MCF8280245.1 gliding motility-associated C-terminal domain-containing protein [Bacteroidales bacterium]MCF8309844.1 gliding motility-associated C-terminal domain-containing protein [Saprospiraceae bacterium]MCF8438825.1 gliding motility-associated C-terminal domain-containing protein [Saprospiraceae 
MSYDPKTVRLVLSCWSLLWLSIPAIAQCPGALGPNVFPDGTLGSGTENVLPYDPGIAPGYWYTQTPPPVDGAYCVTNSTDGWTWFAELFWLDIGDNSPDPNGYMMVVNADYTPGIFYERTVNVCENTPYIFSADIINLFLPQFPDAILPNVDFLMDGNVVFSTGDIPMTMQWQTYEFAFTPPSGVSQFTFSLRNNALGGFGNDLALDNISLRFCGPKITLPAVETNCGGSLNLQPTFEGNPWQNAFYQWQTSFDGGINWSNIPGANAPTLNTQNAQAGQQFRLLMAGAQANLSEPFCRAVSNALTIEMPVYQGFMQATLCQGGSLLLAGNWYSLPGSYQIPLTASNGCDSLLTLDLSVFPISASSLQAEICEGEEFAFGNQSLTNTGDYQMTFTNSLGCDSIVSLHLVVHPKVTVELFEQICEGGSINFGGQIRTVGGDYESISITAHGCDSTTVLHLLVLPELTTNLVAKICEGSSHWFDNQQLELPGIYQMTLQTANGCDSLVTLELTIQPMISSQMTVEICQGSSYLFGTQQLNTAGVYEQTFQTASGCDSLVLLTLNIASQTITHLTEEICEGSIFTFGNDQLTSAGIYQQDLTGASGCDSTVILELSMLPVTTTQFFASICQGSVYLFGNQQLTTPGQYQQLLQTTAGCDSLVVLNLEVLPQLTTNLTAQICEGDSFTFGNAQLMAAGIYEENLTAMNGCDSIVTLALEVLSLASTNLSAQICEGELFPFGNAMLSAAGQYVQTYQTWQGCDSLVTLQLQVFPIQTTDIFAEICEGEAFGGVFYQQNTLLVDTLTSSATGCDSIVRTHLTVWPIVHETIDTFRCWGEEYAGQRVFNDTVIVLSGQTVYGCDSFTVCNVEVASRLEVVIAGSATICSGETTVLRTGNYHAYQWSNEERTASISVNETGNYGITVSDAKGCSAEASHLLFVSIPQIGPVLEEPRCFGEENGEIHLNLSGGIEPYLVSGDGGQFSFQEKMVGLASGNHKIVVKDSIECMAQLEVYLPQPPPFEVYASESQTLALGESVRLDVQATLPVSSIEWLPSDGLSCSDCPNPEAMPLNSTNYNVQAVSEKGCLAENVVALVVEKEEDVYVPTAFSPDGDGINDFFTLYPGRSVMKVKQLNAFDRWGEEVFGIWNAAPFHPSTHWYGDFRGMPVQPGVFVWMAEIEYIDGRTAMLKGEVVLMK